MGSVEKKNAVNNSERARCTTHNIHKKGCP